jgi:hypothetical protein
MEGFDIQYHLLLDALDAPAVQRDKDFLVGANPFDADVRGLRPTDFNSMHVFRSKKRMPIAYPLVGKPPNGSAELLTEDEWEAAVLSIYYDHSPRLKLSGVSGEFQLDWVWPVFPWGFGRKGLPVYRTTSGGTVTQSWHLVKDRLQPGRQICKGGSLRDRGERAFMVARRGSVRIGEYDDFVQRSR